MAEKVLIEGSVDPKLIRDLKEVADGLKSAREESTKLAEVRSEGITETATRLERLGRAAQTFNEIRNAAASVGGAVLDGARALAESAAAGERHATALRGLRGGYEAVSAATQGTVTATAAYRAQQTLVNSGLRINSEELAAVARHAREHRDVTKTAEEAVQELTEALRNGEAEGLRKYGIAAEAGATRAQTFERALRQMRTEATASTPTTRTLGESLSLIGTASTEAAGGFALLVSNGLGLTDVVRDLATGISGLAQDLAELNEQARTAPQRQAQTDARNRATAAYTEAQRGITAALVGQGFDLERARALVPSTPLGRLTPEQIATQAQRLAGLRTQLAGGTPANAPLRAGAEAYSVAEAAAAGQRAAGVTFDATSASAALAGIRVARSGGDQRAVNRATAERLLRAMQTDMAALDRANNRPASAGPRDRAPSAGGNNGPTGDDVMLAQVEADLAVMEALSRGERDARFGTRDEAMRVQRELEARQIDLIQRIGTARRAGENDNARAVRAAGAGQRVSELESGRAARAEAEARLNAEKERSAAEADRAYRAEQTDRRNAKGRDALSRSDEGQAGEHALAVQTERERAQLDERLRMQETFADQWERLHRRQANATTASVDIANGALQKMGQALGAHINAVVSGQETVAEGVAGFVGDVVTGIGQEAVVKSAMETAEGIAAAAGVFTAPLAPGHFAAAAAYAGVGAVALGVGAALGAARGSSAPAAPSAAPALPPPSQAEQAASAGSSLTIVYGAGIIGAPRDIARHIRDIMVDGEQGGTRLPARVVEAA